MVIICDCRKISKKTRLTSLIVKNKNTELGIPIWLTIFKSRNTLKLNVSVSEVINLGYKTMIYL